MDLPDPRDRLGSREGKVVQVLVVVCDLGLGDIDEPDSWTGFSSSKGKVFGRLDNGLSAEDLGHHPPLGTSAHSVNSSFAMGSGKEVVHNLELLTAQNCWEHCDSIEKVALFKML